MLNTPPSQGSEMLSSAASISEPLKPRMLLSVARGPLTSERALDNLQSKKGAAYDTDSVEALVDQLKPRSTCIPLSTGPIDRP